MALAGLEVATSLGPIPGSEVSALLQSCYRGVARKRSYLARRSLPP